jgi:NADH-quinone oxidoreductase subunit D
MVYSFGYYIEWRDIKKIEPHLGYIHRSIEKMCESLSYRQFIYVTSRMDYLSSHINNHGCALTVEKSMQIEIPERAQSDPCNNG